MSYDIERFHALPERSKEAILGTHRDYYVRDDWYTNVYDDFREDMKKVGIDVEHIYFSGFWSQGDGACFEGRVGDWTLFLAHMDIKSAALTKLANEHFTVHVYHQGHYYHENSTRFLVGLPLPESVDDQEFLTTFGDRVPENDLIEAVWLVELGKFDRDELEERFTEQFKSHMKDLYRKLEAEHDHLTSDETVLEALDSNDMLMDAINEQTEKEAEYA